MSTRNILLCFLPILLKFSLSYADDCDRFDSYTDEISIIGETSSSITIRLRLSYCFSRGLNGLSVSYKPKKPIMVPASIKWDSSNYYFMVTPAQVFNDSGSLRFPGTPSTGSKFHEETFTISNLYAPDTIYEFNVKSYRTNGSTFTKLVEGRTLPSIPSKAPKSGVGLFRAELPLNKNYRQVYSKRRDVWIYFQEVYDSWTWLNFTVYEGNTMVYTFSDRLNMGYIYFEIGIKRHRFVLYSHDNSGHYADGYSEVTVPAHEDILPRLVATYYEDEENDTVLVAWETPKNAKVENYTLAWFDDTRLPKVEGVPSVYAYIRDFVILNKYLNKVKLKKANKSEKLVLAMSVNTETGSSGLNYVTSILPAVKNSAEFVDALDRMG